MALGTTPRNIFDARWYIREEAARLKAERDARTFGREIEEANRKARLKEGC